MGPLALLFLVAKVCRWRLIVFHKVQDERIPGIECGTVNIVQKGDAIPGQGGAQIICSYTLSNEEKLQRLDLRSTIDGPLQAVARFKPGSEGGFVNEGSSRNFSSRVKLIDRLEIDQTGVIEFTDASCIDEVTYDCHAEFIAGSSETSANSEEQILPFKVLTKAPDFLNLNEENIIEGSNVTLSCGGGIGYPATDIAWIKIVDSVVINLNTSDTSTSPSTCEYPGNAKSNLTFTATRDDHNAIYKCEIDDGFTTNNYRQIQLKVLYGIKDISITVTPNKTFYDQSTTYIDIKCFSDGNPTTNYSWFRKSDTNVTIGTDNVYRIEPVTEDKNGTYICVATNTVNDVEYRLLADILVNIGYVPSGNKPYIETAAGIATVVCVTLAGVATISFVAFKLVIKGRKMRSKRTVHAESMKDNAETEISQNNDDEGFQSEIEGQVNNIPSVQDQVKTSEQ